MEEDTINQTEIINVDQIYSGEKAGIDSQVSTAKAFPRNITRSTDNAIAIVTMDKDTAQSCTYSLPRGGKNITGPSVSLARILAQTWGNMRVETKIVNIDEKHVTSQAIAFDLENNLAVKVEVKRSIVGKHGRFNDDMITVTGNAGNAIAYRNAVLSVIPKGVVDKVYKSALQAITGDLSDEQQLIKKRKQVFDKFKDDYGVQEEEVLAVIGKASIKNVTQEDIVTLIGLGQAIKDGDTTVEMAFRSKGGTPTVEAVALKKERTRIQKHIENAKTVEDLEQAYSEIEKLDDEDELKKAYMNKHNQLSN